MSFPAQPWDKAVEAAVRLSRQSTCHSKRGAAVWSDEAPSFAMDKPGGGFTLPRSARLVTYACNIHNNIPLRIPCRVKDLHAEQACLLNMLSIPMGLREEPMFMLHVKTVDGELVPSGPPSCAQCSKLMMYVSSSIKLRGMYLYHDNGWRMYWIEEFHQLSVRNDGLPSHEMYYQLQERL